MKKTAPPKNILGSNTSPSNHNRTVIVLTGPRACGKTVLADILTCRGKAGFTLDVAPGHAGFHPYTKAGIRKHVMPWALVVLCAESEEIIKRDTRLKELLATSKLISWSVQKNC